MGILFELANALSGSYLQMSASPLVSLMEVILACVVGSPRIVRKVGECSDMQGIPRKEQRDIPRSERFVSMQVNGVAFKGCGCASGITWSRSAGTKKVR